MPDYATSDEDAEARYQRYKSLDPFPDIQPALLNSADIIDYVAAAGMIFPFHEEARFIKPASYGVALCGRCVYWDADGSCQDFILSRRILDGYEHVPNREEFMLERNSIAFVTLEPFFRLPDYIALRFNLAIREVYRGVLLGTGPLVDPGFHGRLSFPLHNLTDENYFFRPEEHIVWMEFTKVSMWNAWTGSAPQPRSGTPPYPLQQEKKERKDVRDYLRHANGGRPVRSSIPVEVRTATRAAVRSRTIATR
ncbi:MAG: hypothetical protein MN733_27820, partial [Nitrososphaera sp.]|nr:hypothetical protein [Nitrososphaera sp.]